MSFLFGTRADISIDITLILEVVLLAILFFGYRSTRKGDYSTHGKIMLGATAIQLFLIITVMLPSMLRNAPLLLAFNSGVLDVSVHAGLGITTMLLGALLIYAWQSPPKSELHPHLKLPCRRRAKLMKPTIVAWVASFVLGVIFYIISYVI